MCKFVLVAVAAVVLLAGSPAWALEMTLGGVPEHPMPRAARAVEKAAEVAEAAQTDACGEAADKLIGWAEVAAQKVEVVAPSVWGVLILQQRIEALAPLAGCLLVLLVLVWWYFFSAKVFTYETKLQEGRNWWTEAYTAYCWAHYIAPAVVGAVLFFVLLYVLVAAVGPLVNPEFYAIQFLLGAVK